MLEIDGSYGEGGGQILRTSIAFSALTGTPVTVGNIRSGRKNPGLRPQHLKACEAVGLLCGGTVEGLRVGSEKIVLHPDKITVGSYRIDIGTAGSITLLLQALFPVALLAGGNVEFHVTGGTDVKWSPPADYFKNVFIKSLEKIGCATSFNVIKRGYYPKGGGIVEAGCMPWTDKKKFDFNDVVDEYLADQLIPYLALCGGSYRTEKITKHCSTNVWVANQFGYNVVINENVISCESH